MPLAFGAAGDLVAPTINTPSACCGVVYLRLLAWSGRRTTGFLLLENIRGDTSAPNQNLLDTGAMKLMDDLPTQTHFDITAGTDL